MISELKKKLLRDSYEINSNILKYDSNRNHIKNLSNKIIIKCPNCNKNEYILNKKTFPYCNLDCRTNDRYFSFKK